MNLLVRNCLLSQLVVFLLVGVFHPGYAMGNKVNVRRSFSGAQRTVDAHYQQQLRAQRIQAVSTGFAKLAESQRKKKQVERIKLGLDQQINNINNFLLEQKDLSPIEKLGWQQRISKLKLSKITLNHTNVDKFLGIQDESYSYGEYYCNRPLSGCCSYNQGVKAIAYSKRGTIIPQTYGAKVVCNNGVISPSCECYSHKY